MLVIGIMIADPNECANTGGNRGRYLDRHEASFKKEREPQRKWEKSQRGSPTWIGK